MATFGKTDIGGSNNVFSTGFGVGQLQTTGGTGGTLDDIQIYAANGGTIAGFVYNTSGNDATTLVAASSNTTVPSGAGWVTCSFAGEALLANTQYCIGFVSVTSGSDINIYYDSVAGNRNAGSMSDTPPATWTTDSTFTGREYSFYVNYTEDGSDTNVNATLDTLTITDFDTVVTPLVDLNVNATLDTINITNFNTIVTALVDLNVNATADNLTITDFNVTMDHDAGLNILATIDSLSITDFNTIIEALVNININATSDSLLITNIRTSISTGVPATIQGISVSMNLSNSIGINSSIQESSGINVTMRSGSGMSSSV